MRIYALLLLLVSSVALADGDIGRVSGGLTRGNYLRIPDYKTTAALSYFVNASTGNDSFNCQSASSPCLTIQGAVNKLPKLSQHGITVTVAAGTYGCFYVSGFTCDPGVQQTSGGLLFDATAALTNSTLATGTATGTATAGSAGSGTTFGTLTDGAQTWTVNDLKGRFIVITGGTGAGQSRVISSNTGTVVTIVGTWTAPTGTSTYAIQDPGVTINTACNNPASTQAATAANNAAIAIYDNNCAQRTQEIGFQGFRLSNAAGLGVVMSDDSGLVMRLMQIRNTAAASSGLQLGASANASSVAGVGRLDFQDSDLLSNGTSANTITIFSGTIVAARLLVRAGATGITINGPSASYSTSATDLQGATTPVIVSAGRVSSFSGSQITCAGAGTGIQVGPTAATTVSAASAASAGISGTTITTCAIGLLVNGSFASADALGITGSAATTGLQAQSGGTIVYNSTTTVTGATQDINIDLGGATAALADVTAGTCLTTASFGSKVCQR